HDKAPWNKIKTALNQALALRTTPLKQKKRFQRLATLANREHLITDQFLRRAARKSQRLSFAQAVNELGQGLFAIPGNVFVGPTDRADDPQGQHDSHIDESGYETDRSKTLRRLSRTIDKGATNDNLKPLVEKFKAIRARGQDQVAPYNAREWDLHASGKLQKKPKKPKLKPLKEKSRTVDPQSGRTHVVFE